MKNLLSLAIAIMAISMMSCNSNTSNTGNTSSASKSSAKDSLTADTTKAPAPSKEVVQELNKAVTQEHADPAAVYKYDAATNTISMTKEVTVPTGTKEEDYAATLAEVEIPKFIERFKKSTKPSDVTIKKEGIAKGATITVSFVNKATGEEIAQCEITPDDLK